MCYLSETLRLLPDRVRLMMTTALCLEQHPKNAVLLEPGEEVTKFMVVLSGARRFGAPLTRDASYSRLHLSDAPTVLRLMHHTTNLTSGNMECSSVLPEITLWYINHVPQLSLFPAGNMESFEYAPGPGGTPRMAPKALYKRSDCYGSSEMLTNRPSEAGLLLLSNVQLLTIPRREYLRMVGR